MSSHVLAARECLIGDRHNAEIKTVSELVSASKIFVEDGNHGENRPRQDEFCDQGNGIPFLRPPDLKEGRVDFRKCDFINAQGFARVRKGIGKPGDVILTHRATVGRIAITGSDAPTVFVTNPGTTIWRSLDKDLLDQRYLYFYMSSRIFQDRLFSEVGHTSTFDYVSLTQQRTLPVVIPGIRLQRQIAHILGNLDEKIELNRKTNETLEAMAKALFKSWFVDFDPVRAKAESCPTGLPDEISDLFPDSFEDSELGEIPSGWKCSPLADRALYLSRGISPAYCEEGGVIVLNQKCVRDSRISFEKARRHDTTKKQIIGREVRRFDALVNSTGVGTLGRVAMMPICKEEVVVDSHVTVVRGGDNRESFFISSTLLNRQTEIEALGEGSTGQTELSRVVLGSLPIIFPSSELISAFFESAYTFQDKIEKNDQASVALASARDALLPRLISGEIRIPDAEKMLEEVGI
jgi:type I restriction enzyme S subunit